MTSWMERRRKTSGWSRKLVEWESESATYLSIVFSWQLEKARERIIELIDAGHNVRAGGPAIALNPDYLSDLISIDCLPDRIPLTMHNLNATFTTRGCVRKCKFCAVPRIEGDFMELDEWEPKPIICDNNFLASSDAHFNQVIDRLRQIKNIDFNQGLDARLLTPERADRLSELNYKCLRLAWDNVRDESAFMQAFEMLRKARIPARKIYVYVLIGFRDTPEDALYRLRTVWNMKALPFAMRYQPLDAPKRNSYVDENWTDYELRKMSRYWTNTRYLSKIPYEEFDPNYSRKKVRTQDLGTIEIT